MYHLGCDLPIHCAVCGGSAAAFAAAMTTPFDVIKTRYQVLRDSKDAAGSARAMLVQTLREGGWRSLIAGLGARMMWVGMNSGVTLAAC